MRRRDFITLLGGAGAAWPIAARAQLPPRLIGYLDTESLETRRVTVAGIHRGLAEGGYIEGQNLSVVYRWAENRLGRLPELVADLVGRQVAVVIAVPDASALAAKGVTNSTPIVFLVGANPVESGLVTSLSRPGANLTGIYSLSAEMAAKRLELLHELLPAAKSLAYLVNPANAVVAESETKEMHVAARHRDLTLLVVHATSVSEFEAAFATLIHGQAEGLVIGTDGDGRNSPFTTALLKHMPTPGLEIGAGNETGARRRDQINPGRTGAV